MKHLAFLFIIVAVPWASAKESTNPTVVAMSALARALLLNRNIEVSQNTNIEIKYEAAGISGRMAYRIESPDITIVLDEKTGLPVSYVLNSKYLVGNTARERLEDVLAEGQEKAIREKIKKVRPMESLGYSRIGVEFSYETTTVYPGGHVTVPRINNGIIFMDEHAVVTMPYKSEDGLSTITVRVSDDIAMPAVIKENMVESEVARLRGFEWMRSKDWITNKSKRELQLEGLKYQGVRYAHDNPRSLEGEGVNDLAPLDQPISLVHHYLYHADSKAVIPLFAINVEVYSGAVRGIWSLR